MNSTCGCEDWQTCGAKLEYFGFNGRASNIRAILYYKGVPFTDEKYTFEQWGALKKSGNYEFEQLPAFECNGRRMFQSPAITLWLARQFNLLGSNSFEEYLNISLLNSMEDFLPKFVPAVWAFNEEQQAQLETKKKEFLEIHAPFFLKIYENRFLKNRGAYAIGDTFGLSDIIFTTLLHDVFKNDARKDTWESVLNQNAPELAKHIQKITENELAPFFAKGYIY